jgi:RNA polymerase sigma-70 factor (ECF subfamily)
MSSANSPQQQAIAALYSNHHGWLTRWLGTRLACSEQAADIAQETYLRILTAPRYMAPEQPRAFLVTIAKGLLVDYFRRSALERAYLDVLALQPEAEQPSPEYQVATLQLLVEIDRLLDGLSRNARVAFLLDRIDGVPQEQIAAQLGVSTRRVRQYLTQALRHCYHLQFGVTR